MNCVICQNNLPEFRLVNRSSLRQNESNYVEVCIDCLNIYCKTDPDALLLLPRKIVKLSHYIERDSDKDMYTDLTKIPWIYENINAPLYKFELYLGLEDPTYKSLFCVITEDFNIFRETKNILNTSYNNYELAPNYLGIYNSADSRIIAIYKINDGVVESLDPHQNLTFQPLNKTNTMPFSIPANRQLLSDIILKQTPLQLFTDVEMQEYLIFPKVIEKNK